MSVSRAGTLFVFANNNEADDPNIDLTIGPPVMQRRNCFSPGRAHSRAHNSRRMAGYVVYDSNNPAATRSTSGRFHRVRGNGRCR